MDSCAYMSQAVTEDPEINQPCSLCRHFSPAQQNSESRSRAGILQGPLGTGAAPPAAATQGRQGQSLAPMVFGDGNSLWTCTGDVLGSDIQLLGSQLLLSITEQQMSQFPHCSCISSPGKKYKTGKEPFNSPIALVFPHWERAR